MALKSYDTQQLILASIGFAIVIFGIAGNLLVVIAVWKKRFLRSTTNYLLVNLAVSDILNLVFLPFMLLQLYAIFEGGPFADFLCKFIMSFNVPLTASCVSILTLIVLSVERYHAIVKPMKEGMRLREETVKYAIITVWLSGIALSLPFYIFGHYDTTKHRCKLVEAVYKYTSSIYFISIGLLILIFVPFLIISFCYFQIVRELYFKSKVEPQNVAAQEDARTKRKLVKVSLTVTLAYVICFFPTAITLCLGAYDRAKYGSRGFQMASLMYFLESALNPLFYACQSTNFRQAFKEVMKCH
ncbi:somatostatin receptor type 5-like [Actinia tenebrosa]|uniref:Somatostatin receptor type 5-like n=1 Tax=Actinia tenebrosa TaxID=6105 RepID=A0A6P8ICI8_ACTTE|nr:somatostatin receptor type 5-like [Actinia tenebrosa]